MYSQVNMQCFSSATIRRGLQLDPRIDVVKLYSTSVSVMHMGHWMKLNQMVCVTGVSLLVCVTHINRACNYTYEQLRLMRICLHRLVRVFIALSNKFSPVGLASIKNSCCSQNLYGLPRAHELGSWIQLSTILSAKL